MSETFWDAFWTASRMWMAVGFLFLVLVVLGGAAALVHWITGDDRPPKSLGGSVGRSEPGSEHSRSER